MHNIRNRDKFYEVLLITKDKDSARMQQNNTSVACVITYRPNTSHLTAQAKCTVPFAVLYHTLALNFFVFFFVFQIDDVIKESSIK